MSNNMPNIAQVLKAEIERIAKKALRAETTSLKKASAMYRSDIDALKRRAHELVALRGVRHVGPDGERPPPECLDLTGHLLEELDAPRGQHDVGTVLREDECGASTDAGPRAGDDGDAIFERETLPGHGLAM